MKEQQEIEFAYEFLKEILISHRSGMHQDDILNVIIMNDTLGWILDLEGETEFADTLKLLNEHAYGPAN
jgi:hypothetical protein